MSDPLRILIVEDEEADAILTQRELRRQGLAFTARRVDRDEALIRALREWTPDLVLSDFALPGFSGLEALAIVRKEQPGLPLIFVSGTVGEEQAVELVKMGATDYVLKDNLARLPGSVKRALREVALERESRRAETHYKEVFENAVVGIYQAAPDGRLLAVNGALASMYGYATPEEMMGAVRNGARLFVEQGRAEEFAAALAEKKEVRHFRSEMRRKNGSRFWVSQHASVVPAGAGTEARYGGFVADMADLREESMRGGSAAGGVTGEVAHDLNNLLSPISMAVSMLRGSLGEAEREKMCAIIEDSTRRASEILRRASGAGRGADKKGVPLEFGQVIRAVFQKLPQTWTETVRIKLAVADDLWRATGDPAQIERAVLALCLNAGQAMMPGGGTLRLGVANRQIEADEPHPLPDAKPGAYVEVEVGDTGPGIAPEALARVFDPFRATGERGKQGLDSVREVVREHGGFVDVAAVPGEGTTFKLYLPAAREEAVVKPSVLTNNARTGECILLVDDEETIRFAARAVLSKQGYRVLTATDGADALKVFNARGDEVALVLTDLMMPVMGGMALASALRQARPGLPIIMSSGENEKTRLAEMQAAGVTAVLSKPYASEVLLRKVGEVLEGRR